MKGQFSLRTCKCSICEVNILAEPRISECLIIINYASANTAKKVVSASNTLSLKTFNSVNMRYFIQFKISIPKKSVNLCCCFFILLSLNV